MCARPCACVRVRVITLIVSPSPNLTFSWSVASSNIARKAEELPYHYIATNNIEGLRRCLLTREIFEQLYTERTKQVLMQYWQVAGGYQLAAESYKKALQDFLSVSCLVGPFKASENF